MAGILSGNKGSSLMAMMRKEGSAPAMNPDRPEMPKDSERMRELTVKEAAGGGFILRWTGTDYGPSKEAVCTDIDDACRAMTAYFGGEDPQAAADSDTDESGEAEDAPAEPMEAEETDEELPEE